MIENAQAQTARHGRLAELVDRLPVLLDSLLDALADDAGDNLATFVLASVALEAARELQELERLMPRRPIKPVDGLASPLAPSLAASGVAAGELVLDEFVQAFDSHLATRYRGTQAQLVAEGLVPTGVEWPVGYGVTSWARGNFSFTLKYSRPHKGAQVQLWRGAKTWDLWVFYRGHKGRDWELRRERVIKERFRNAQQVRKESIKAAALAADDQHYQCFRARVIPPLGMFHEADRLEAES